MGFPRIIYGANSDQVVDFEEYPREGSGYGRATRIFEDESESGIESSYYYFTRGILNLNFKAIPPHVKAQLEAFREYAQDGSTFIVEMDRDLVGCWAFENQSLLSNDQSETATFSHTTVTNARSYLNFASVLQFLNTSDVARFPQGKYGSGVLVEPSRTNLIGKSKTLDGTGWSGVQATCAISTDVKDVANGTDVYKITASGTGSYLYLWGYESSTAVSTNDAVFSVWLKTISGNKNVKLGISGDTGGGGGSDALVVTPDWQRFQFSVDNGDDSPTGDWNVQIALENSGDIVYACFAQLEAGVDVKNASSYIESDAGATVTRGSEDLTYSAFSALALPSFLPSMSVGFWFKPDWLYNEHPEVVLFQTGADLSSMSSSVYITTGGNITMVQRNAAGIVVNFFGSGASITQNQWHHLAVTANATISNGAKIYLDGTLLNTSTNSAFSPVSTGNQFVFGNALDGSESCSCTLDELFITKSILTASDINNIANEGVGTYFGRNRMTCRLVNKDFDIVPKFGGISEALVSTKEVIT